MAVAFPAPQPVDPLEVHINHFFDRVVACAQHRRATLLTAAHEKRQEMAARVTEREHSEQQLLSARAEIERHLRENLLQETQELLLAEIERKLEVLRAPVPTTFLVFRGECEQLEQLIECLGGFYEEEVPVGPRYSDMLPTVAVAKRGKAPGKLWNPHGVAIDPVNSRIYVAEGIYNFARVSTFSKSGEYLSSYTHKYMKALWGIAIHENNLYVTDYEEHAVFHLKIEAGFRLVARLRSKGSGIGQFNQPRQLSISTNGDVYVADEDNNRIQVLDSSLHPIREITHPSMHHPYDVKLMTEEMYVLSSSDSPCVHVFTHTGHKTRSLITRDGGMQVTVPFFFCLDPKKNLIISDYMKDQIKIFSNEASLLHTIGEDGQQVGMFNYPQGLALTSNLNLVTVSLNDNHGLQIFSSL